MADEKALALVLRTTDWSETSRIATLWTREFGKVRALAKGGRRLKSNFESALDLLTVCSIVLLRKSSGGLDLLTEARVVRPSSAALSMLWRQPVRTATAYRAPHMTTHATASARRRRSSSAGA